MKRLRDYQDGEHFSGMLLVANAAKCVSNQGKTYYNLELRDASGSVNAKKWDVTPEDERILVAGNILEIQGEMNLYRNALQLKVLYCAIPSEPIDPSLFAKQSPISKETLLKDFEYYRSQIKDESLVKVVDYVLNKRKDLYFDAPGGVSIHHDYTNGLLHHTVSMLHHADYFINFYGDFDKELLYAAIILHDVDKTVEIEGSLSYKRSLEGQLLGHLSMGAAEIQEAKTVLDLNDERIMLLEHMILSHHGEPEYGSPVYPMTKEAMLLNFIDSLDCYMNIASKALENVKEGEFSEKIFSMNNRQLYKPHKR